MVVSFAAACRRRVLAALAPALALAACATAPAPVAAPVAVAAPGEAPPVPLENPMTASNDPSDTTGRTRGHLPRTWLRIG